MTPPSEPGDGEATSDPASGPDPAEQRAAELRRRARRAAVFGEVLPESTGDDRDVESGEGDNDAWLRGNVPPHHG